MAEPGTKQPHQSKNRVARVYLEDLWFDAQQAAEKAIKAVFISRGIDFPYVHDLAELLTLLDRAGEVVPLAVDDATRLTSFAIVTRYPGAVESVTTEEYERAVAIAETVVAWAEERVRTGWGDSGR